MFELQQQRDETPEIYFQREKRDGGGGGGGGKKNGTLPFGDVFYCLNYHRA